MRAAWQEVSWPVEMFNERISTAEAGLVHKDVQDGNKNKGGLVKQLSAVSGLPSATIKNFIVIIRK